MSGTSGTPIKQGLKQGRGGSRTRLRWFAVGWWVVIVYLALNLRDTIVSDLWPALHDALAAMLAQVGGWPLLDRIGFGVLVAVVLVGFVWLTVFAFQKQKEVAEETAKEEREARISEQQEGNEPLQKPLEKLVELAQQQNNLTRQQIELLSSRLAEEAPPVPEAVAAPTGLPRPSTLVGREGELKQLMDGLRVGESVGIFALAGMGGVGKSAIAAEAVAQLSEERDVFPGGAIWIPCDDLRGDEGLAELWMRVARELRLEHVVALVDSQVRRVALRAELVRGKRMLLALDNIEPGQGAKLGLDAEAALDTLAVRGHTAVLLTARQVVAPQRLVSISVAPLEASHATTLLLQRLQQIDATRPMAQEASAIPKLLEAVGGLPLAIELTAAYAGVQRRSLNTVLSEIEADGLKAGALRGDAKRGMLQSFERSWRVLTARQQRLFAGLSLLAGASFPHAAALALAQATVPKVIN